MTFGPLVAIEPFRRFAAVTASDSTTYGTTTTPPIDALYVGGAGALALAGSDGVATALPAVPAGTVLGVSPSKIMATGTTATNIVALYR